MLSEIENFPEREEVGREGGGEVLLIRGEERMVMANYWDSSPGSSTNSPIVNTRRTGSVDQQTSLVVNPTVT